MSENRAERTRTARLRGEILKVVYQNQKQQGTRFDHLHLLDFFNELHYELSENELLTLLQDLGERGYMTFEQETNRRTGEVSFRKLQITPLGRDIILGFKTDGAVRIE